MRRSRIFAFFAVTLIGRAVQLPIKTYTTSDGLPSGFVDNVVRDSRGFLWFCTRDGLSRFDGSRFVNYTVRDGLPHPNVSNLVETRKGEYWVGTFGGGVAHFQPLHSAASPSGTATRNLFTAYSLGSPLSDNIGVLFEDRAERLWAGTADGLFLLQAAGGRTEFRRVSLPWQGNVDVASLIEDSDGNLIAGSSHGVLKIRYGDGISVKVIEPLREATNIRALLFDREGNLWIGQNTGLLLIDSAGVRHDYATQDSPVRAEIYALHQSSDGRVWIGSSSGITEFKNGHFQSHSGLGGFQPTPALGIAEDRDGNLWVASQNGAMKLALNGFLTYNRSDGLTPASIASIFEDREGSLVAVGTNWRLSRFDGAAFHEVQPRLPAGAAPPWGTQMAVQDHTGEWWLMLPGGLWRFARTGWNQLSTARPIAIYDAGNSPIRTTPTRMFEDRQGDLWISGRSGDRYQLILWERDRQVFRTFSDADGLPPAATANAPFAFVEDRLGRLWIGFYGGGIARYDGQRFRMFGAAEGMPGGTVTSGHLDRSGRLWFGTNQNGLVRIDEVAGDRPIFRTYTVSGGLSSNNTRSITEDRMGRLYIGTVRGVDRLDPQTDRYQHYAQNDGLAGDFVNAAFCDRRGVLWFGTSNGLSCLVPGEEARIAPDPVWIGGLKIDGTPYPVSELGAANITALQLGPGSRHLQIDFFGLSFRMGSPLRYQYQLEGADRDWSAPGDQRSVNYARLTPGGYRFLVRTVDVAGAVSLPASVTFRVLRPFWWTWWFLAISVTAGISGLYAVHRARLARALQLEGLRSRLATDLHDDIGTSLSQIAILSEVAHRQHDSGAMFEIAAISRETVDAMSDIVWVTNPRHDHLNDLIYRMRRFAIDSLTASGIEMQFQATGFDRDLRLAPEIRRQVYLIFKEAITNIARHSQASHARVHVKVERDVLTLTVADDGSGFDEGSLEDGNGLASIRKRAADLAGSGELRSRPGEGTAWTVVVHLGRHGKPAGQHTRQH